MTEQDLIKIQETIVSTVNGKIDSLTKTVNTIKECNDIHIENHDKAMEKINEHIAKVEPYLQSVNGIRALGNGLKWVGGLAVAWLAVEKLGK